MPSLAPWPVLLFGMTIAAGLHPGSSVGKRGRAAEPSGNVTGSLPLGFVLPVSTSAVARPPAWPGYHISSTDFTLASHGMYTGSPVLSTTTVFGFAAATAEISASW